MKSKPLTIKQKLASGALEGFGKTTKPQEGGSQDSIDSILKYLVDNVAMIRHRVELRHLKPADAFNHNERLKAEAKAKIETWHNTQLKAAIPEKRKLPGINEEWQEAWMHRPGGVTDYNQAIDDMERNLEQ